MDSIVTTATAVGQWSTIKACSERRSMAGRCAERMEVYALTLRVTVCTFRARTEVKNESGFSVVVIDSDRSAGLVPRTVDCRATNSQWLKRADQSFDPWSQL